jgi:hypothetical protein
MVAKLKHTQAIITTRRQIKIKMWRNIIATQVDVNGVLAKAFPGKNLHTVTVYPKKTTTQMKVG